MSITATISAELEIEPGADKPSVRSLSIEADGLFDFAQSRKRLDDTLAKFRAQTEREFLERRGGG